ncbi:eukaryotic rRNA processing protein EBP2-domain-containing protein [Aspergillus unguis]
MPKRSKLLQALDEHKGRDYDAEKQKKMVKAAKKRKGLTGQKEDDSVKDKKKKEEDEDESIGDADKPEQDESGEENDEDEEDEEEEQEEDIPLSDLSEDEREDVVPHQRLTINNTSALSSSTKRISFISNLTPFSEHNSLIAQEDETSTVDANDDLTRELAFYKTAQSAALLARKLLKKEGIPFTRPGDYFAEMVKTDEHMGKIKKKLYDEAASKKAAADARKQRDLKKFGKQVQVAKLQQRAKEKKEAIEKINELKKKRKAGSGTGGAAGDDDLFDVAVEDAVAENPRKRSRGESGPSMKRQKKNEKYGFGGKKRHAKSGDAMSSGDLRNFSVKKMKGGAGGPKRPGKSKRAAARGRS